MDSSRLLGVRRLAPLLILALSGCASGIRLGDASIITPSKCPEIQVMENGDVELCHHRWARWTGAELERDGETLFVVNRGLITSHGHEVAKADAKGITVFLADDIPDRHIRVEPSGKVLDEQGNLVATISPPPEDDMPTLVFAALIREGIWVPELPQKPKRRRATESQTIGESDEDEASPPLCSCTGGD